MITKISIITSVTIASLLFAVYQPGNSITYSGHDGSLDDHLEKAVVKPYSNKKDYWVYIVRACAAEHNLGVSAVILKSDLQEIVLNVNKSIKKGDCSHYGAVMKAKDGLSLGAEMIERHEAVSNYHEILEKLPELKNKQKEEARKEVSFYRYMIGGML